MFDPLVFRIDDERAVTVQFVVRRAFEREGDATGSAVRARDGVKGVFVRIRSPRFVRLRFGVFAERRVGFRHDARPFQDAVAEHEPTALAFVPMEESGPAA